MRYRLKTRCFFEHESLKRDNKKNDDIKNIKSQERIKRSSLKCCCVFKVIILKKQQSIMYKDHELYQWVQFPQVLLTILFSKISKKSNLFQLKEYLRMKQYYLIVAIQFSVIAKGFHNMQFKSSTHKKLQQLAVSEFDSENLLLNCNSNYNS